MNPVIIIPSYWTDGTERRGSLAPGTYDYATPITKPLPELELCLTSLEQVRGVLRVIVLVVAPRSCEEAARARARSICRAHPSLNAIAVSGEEARLVTRKMGRVAPGLMVDGASMRGYGAIRNMGLALACVFGHDSLVFIDDDEVVTSPDFLLDAVYGLGSLTRQDIPILAKSGYYVRADGSPYAGVSTAWSERFWTKYAGFNSMMAGYLTASTRIVRSSYLCGGCCALHARAFTKVPFDPFITRGEDLDYLLNLRARGIDVWFDSALSVQMRPSEDAAPGPDVFMQDVYRWLYEYRKLEFINSRRSLRKVTPGSLMPYPGPWLSSDVRSNVRKTAARRILAGPDRLRYLDILTRGIREADAYGRENAPRYLSFAALWPDIAATLWDNRYLQADIESSAAVALKGGKR